MNRTGCSDDALFTTLLEHCLFLPVLQHFQLGGDELQFFFHLGEEGLGGTGFLFVTEGQFNTLAQQLVREAALTTLAGGTRAFLFNIVRQLVAQGIDLGFQLDFIEQGDLVSLLFTAGRELLDLLMAQQLFEDFDASVPPLYGVLFEANCC